MTAEKLRQAVQTAIDAEPAMVAVVGNEEFYRSAQGNCRGCWNTSLAAGR
jgi:hypothetical protein